VRALRAVGGIALIYGCRGRVLASMPAPLNLMRGSRFRCVPEFHSARHPVAPCIRRAIEDKDGAAPFLTRRRPRDPQDRAVESSAD
jgi:hypothetical protein